MTPPPLHNRRPATTEPGLLTQAGASPQAELHIASGLTDMDPDEMESMAADPEPETGPLRRCIVTRERLPKERMVRFVLGPDRVIVPDLAAKLPGRGIWLSARGDVLETACHQGSLVRAFARFAAKEAVPNTAHAPAEHLTKAGAKAGRVSVTLPPDPSGLIEAMLIRRIVELLGLARRAGQAVCGFQKAREWITSGRAGLVLQAADGSLDERARFLSGVKTVDLNLTGLPVAEGIDATDAGPKKDGPKAALPVGTPLSAASLGAVFGRDHGVHVVLAPGRLAEALTHEIARLSGLTRRTQPGLKNAKAGPKPPAAMPERWRPDRPGPGKPEPDRPAPITI